MKIMYKNYQNVNLIYKVSNSLSTIHSGVVTPQLGPKGRIESWYSNFETTH